MAGIGSVFRDRVGGRRGIDPFCRAAGSGPACEMADPGRPVSISTNFNGPQPVARCGKRHRHIEKTLDGVGVGVGVPGREGGDKIPARAECHGQQQLVGQMTSSIAPSSQPSFRSVALACRSARRAASSSPPRAARRRAATMPIACANTWRASALTGTSFTAFHSRRANLLDHDAGDGTGSVAFRYVTRTRLTDPRSNSAAVAGSGCMPISGKY